MLISRVTSRSLPLLNEVTGQKPREIAARVLGKRWDSDEYTETLLERSLAPARLSPADRGLTQELVFGVIRWQATLDWLIDRKTQGRRQKTGLQDLLRLGLYQIFWLDRIPDHAAVHETVEQAKRGGYGAQAGFINAVLRGYVREADETRRALAELKASDPALGFSHPDWLVQRWQKRFGTERTAQLLESNNTPPKTFARINTLRTDATKLIEAWRDEGVDYDFLTRDWTDENLAFELKSHPPLTSLESFRKGWFYIQDPSTLLSIKMLDPQPGQTILDLCAAPGGKTTFIAQLMSNTGRIVAHDNVPERLKLIEENCARLGVTNTELASPETFNLQPSTFNRVLVDAPCSNTGVLRRRVDLRWRIQLEEIERLRATQRDLLEKSAKLLNPGGILIYSTCSLETEENAELVQTFLASHPAFRLECERQLLPFADGTDGAYAARLTKAG